MESSFKAHHLILGMLFLSYGVPIILFRHSLEMTLLFGQLVSLLIPLLVFLSFTGGRGMERLALRPVQLRPLIGATAVVLVLQPFLMLLAAGAEKLAGNPMAMLLTELEALPFWMALLGLAVIPALTEELLFRGWLLQSYSRQPEWAAALLNGAVFGMFHMNLYQFSYALVLGFFFAVATRRSGSVIPAISMHFLNNLISVLLLESLNTEGYQMLDSLLQNGTTPGWGLVVGSAIAIFSLTASWKLMDRVLPKPEPEPAQEQPEPQPFAIDWSLTVLFALFTLVAVAEPVLKLIRGF